MIVQVCCELILRATEREAYGHVARHCLFVCFVRLFVCKAPPAVVVCRLNPPGQPGRQNCVIVMDLHGLGVDHMHRSLMRCFKRLNDCDAANYPELVGGATLFAILRTPQPIIVELSPDAQKSTLSTLDGSSGSFGQPSSHSSTPRQCAQRQLFLIRCVFEMTLNSDSYCFVQATKVHVHCAGDSFEDLTSVVGADNLPVELGGTLCDILTAVFEYGI